MARQVCGIICAIIFLFERYKMKKRLFFRTIGGLVLAGSLSVFAAAQEASEPLAVIPLEEELGYFFGYSFGNMLRDGGSDDVDIDSLIKGMKDSLSGTAPDLDEEQRERIYAEIRARQQVITEKRQTVEAQAAQEAELSIQRNLATAIAYLQENAKRPEVKTTKSGLQYEVLTQSGGSKAKIGSQVVVNYVGRLINGEVFDESGETPAEFGLNQVIPGWTEGLQLMSAGDKYRLFLHPDLAYGAGGVGRIPPNSLLIFDVELLEIK